MGDDHYQLEALVYEQCMTEQATLDASPTSPSNVSQGVVAMIRHRWEAVRALRSAAIAYCTRLAREAPTFAAQHFCPTQ